MIVDLGHVLLDRDNQISERDLHLVCHRELSSLAEYLVGGDGGVSDGIVRAC